ncbi:MAG TPA: hypothetical protein VGF55_08185, partial [Gemmataceae bacterium]
MTPACRTALVLVSAALAPGIAHAADEAIDRKYPLDPQLAVLARDVASPDYRKLVLEKMLVTDLAAEWQRVATADNPDSFLAKHGKDKVLADPDLKRAYERRMQIRTDFLDLMRQGYKRYKKPAPFDQGAKAELAGTLTKNVAAPAVAVAPVLPCPGAERNWP